MTSLQNQSNNRYISAGEKRTVAVLLVAKVFLNQNSNIEECFDEENIKEITLDKNTKKRIQSSVKDIIDAIDHSLATYQDALLNIRRRANELLYAFLTHDSIAKGTSLPLLGAVLLYCYFFETENGKKSKNFSFFLDVERYYPLLDIYDSDINGELSFEKDYTMCMDALQKL